MELATTLELTILHLTSLVVMASPRLLDEPYAFTLRVASVAAPFVRATLVSRILASTHYVLVEFSLALVSMGFFTTEYSELPVASVQVHTNNSLV